ncbi:MAG: hypothetical protein RMK57_01765 [Bryobacterales bacterium]|nr:hypothetical protein [Bryobacteraceae bacterium]MDW8353232.1 hypothetical protein [Bryobacterales bacterium]
MAFRAEKTTFLVLSIVCAAAAETIEFSVRHDHAFRDRPGILRIRDDGMAYAETAKKGKSDHDWFWGWEDIQQLVVAEDELRVLTYRDSKWRLGADRAYTFRAANGQSFRDAYVFLRERLDQRLVAALADETVRPIWQLPVKLLGRLWGSEGFLLVGEDRIVYRTSKPGRSRTWRDADIANISSTGPFELTITTFERSRFHYGNWKAFHFQLRQPLDELRYRELWRRLHQGAGPR